MDTSAPAVTKQGPSPSPGRTYKDHFGLGRLPFENVPDPDFFFNQGEYQRVLRRITDALTSGRGLMVVAGPIGSGKTTLSQRLMSGLPEKTAHLWLAEPPGTDREILQMLLRRLGYPLEWGSRVLALGALRDRLLKIRASGGRFLLVVDESHKITDQGLETIRLLNNLEEGASKLIQILLFGQEELSEMLTLTSREAFRQRIANFELLGCMSPPQVRDYIRHRLRVAGGDPALFPDALVEAVAAAARGIPRLTNSLCDRALLIAFERGNGAVEAADLLKAAEDLGMYSKAFPFLLGRGTAGPSTPPADPGAADPGEADPGPTADLAENDGASGARANGSPSPLAGPLALLAVGVAALAASLLYYCSRAAELYGDACLPHLFADLFVR